jgi:hypothetical protein
MNKLSTRNPFKKVLRNSTDKDLQANFRRFLDQACTKFQVRFLGKYIHFSLTAAILQIQILMDVDMKMVAIQTLIKQLDDNLSSYDARLTEIQASAIKIGWYKYLFKGTLTVIIIKESDNFWIVSPPSMTSSTIQTRFVPQALDLEFFAMLRHGPQIFCHPLSRLYAAKPVSENQL